jgi:hypothetical protein
MNNDQLELALEQAQKMERNGKVWTAVGTGMLVGGAVMTFRGISNISYVESFNYGTFGTGLVIMCFSALPLGYGMVAWISGNERANMIEIELLAFNTGMDTSSMFLHIFNTCQAGALNMERLEHRQGMLGYNKLAFWLILWKQSDEYGFLKECPSQVHHTITNVRSDFLHKLSTEICTNHTTVYVE